MPSTNVFSSKNVNRKKLKKVLFFVGMGALAVIVLVVGLSAIFSQGDTTEDNTHSVETPSPSLSPSISSGAIENPFNGKNISARSDSSSTTSVKDNVVRQTGGQSLSVDAESYPITAPADPCVLSKEQDFCLSATSRVGTLSYDVFSFYDIVKSPIFGAAQDVHEVQVKGAQSAFGATMSVDSGDPRQVLAVATQDGSGYLLVSPPGASRGDIDALAHHVEIR